MGSFGSGAVGYPSSSTSGRAAPCIMSLRCSSSDRPRALPLAVGSGRCRDIGGGIASSSLSVSPPEWSEVSRWWSVLL